MSIRYEFKWSRGWYRKLYSLISLVITGSICIGLFILLKPEDAKIQLLIFGGYFFTHLSIYVVLIKKFTEREAVAILYDTALELQLNGKTFYLEFSILSVSRGFTGSTGRAWYLEPKGRRSFAFYYPVRFFMTEEERISLDNFFEELEKVLKE